MHTTKSVGLGVRRLEGMEGVAYACAPFKEERASGCILGW